MITMEQARVCRPNKLVGLWTVGGAEGLKRDGFVRACGNIAYLYPRHLCRGVYSFPLDVCLFVCSYVRSFVSSFVRVLVHSLLSVTFVEFTTKFLVKVSLSEYISLTKHQKAFIFEPWVPLAPGLMPRGGAKGQNLGHC